MTDESVRLQAALEFAAKKHSNQFRIGGEPFITHPVAVAEIVREQGYGTDYLITALFHDLLEDTDATEEEIEAFGNREILKAVKLLTKEKDYVMNDYIEGIKSNDMAFVVKSADRLHNLKSAVSTNENFRRRYILETVEWYFDFSEEIRIATKELAATLSRPVAEIYKKM
jgi:(p)ppGpp synthase/HD superfamily hydrolase